MRIFKIVFLFAVFSVGCGSEVSRLHSVTDMKSVLLYQHVEADKFRLLACPYAVDLQIEKDCRNVFITATGGEHYFTGVPKQPLLFAPSQDTMKKVLLIPIVAGGALLSWKLLRKLRVRQISAVTKQDLDGALLKMGDDLQRITDEELAQAVAKRSAAEYRRLAKGVAKYRDSSKVGAKRGFTYKTSFSKPKAGQPTITIDEYRQLLNNEVEFINRQLASAHAASKNFNFNAVKSGVFKQAPSPRAIFADFQAAHDEAMQAMLNSIDEKLPVRVREEALQALAGLHEHSNDLVIGGFLREFTDLIESPQVFAKIREEQIAFRTEVLESLSEGGKLKPSDLPDNLKDYLIAAAGGLLAGAYLPDKIPALDNYLFTAREWKKLFARDDTLKNPLQVGDSYTVVKKLAQHLRRKGEKIAINEQIFFGLRN